MDHLFISCGRSRYSHRRRREGIVPAEIGKSSSSQLASEER